MAGLGQLAAATGLAKSVDYVGETQREFFQLENVQREIEKSQQENMLAQEMEAKQYEEIAKSASEMLGPDRLKIQAKSLELQKNIRAKIEEYGSRKAFFANGGVGLISKYKNDVINSAESMSYNDNKKNMESLMKIMADGKGHLISDIDKRSLDEYNSGTGSGKISYSGMKSEVVIPEKYYNYGQNVPAEVILKSNYLQIYNNWLLDNPTLNNLTGDSLKSELLSYTMTNHYGQGINMLEEQNRIAEKNYQRQQRQQKDAGTDKEAKSAEAKEETYKSGVAEMNYAFNSALGASPVTLQDLLSEGNYTLKLASQNSDMGNLAGKMTSYDDIDSNYVNAKSSNSILGKDSWGDKITKGVSRSLGFDNKFKVAGAAIVPGQTMSKEVIEALYPGSVSANEVNVVLNQSEYYSPDGEKLRKEYIEDFEGTMKHENLIYGYMDDQDKMVVKKLDSNGKNIDYKVDVNGKYIVKDGEKDIYSGNIRHEMFAVLRSSDGKKVYKRIPSNSLIAESALANAIGKADNIAEAKNERTEKAVKAEKIEGENKWTTAVIQNNVARASAPGEIFSTPELQADMKLTKIGNNTDRVEMVKAYYMALSAMTENQTGVTGDFTPATMKNHGYYLRTNADNFQNKINYSQKIKDALLDKNNYSDEQFINFAATTFADGKDEDMAENQQLADNWIKFLNFLKK